MLLKYILLGQLSCLGGLMRYEIPYICITELFGRFGKISLNKITHFVEANTMMIRESNMTARFAFQCLTYEVITKIHRLYRTDK